MSTIVLSGKVLSLQLRAKLSRLLSLLPTTTEEFTMPRARQGYARGTSKELGLPLATPYCEALRPRIVELPQTSQHFQVFRVVQKRHERSENTEQNDLLTKSIGFRVCPALIKSAGWGSQMDCSPHPKPRHLLKQDPGLMYLIEFAHTLRAVKTRASTQPIQSSRLMFLVKPRPP